jgi:cytochrome c
MSFELNKILGALLTAFIVAFVTGLVGNGLVPSEKREGGGKEAYPIKVANAPAAAAAPAAAEAKPAPLPPELLAKADPVKGEEIAKKCAQCHSFAKGEPNHVGPNLWGVIGRARASAPGFSYSDSLKALGGNWTVQEIGAFIYNPKLYLPGTKMGFIGLPKPEDRVDVLAWLNKNSDAPVDLAKAD